MILLTSIRPIYVYEIKCSILTGLFFTKLSIKLFIYESVLTMRRWKMFCVPKLRYLTYKRNIMKIIHAMINSDENELWIRIS